MLSCRRKHSSLLSLEYISSPFFDVCILFPHFTLMLLCAVSLSFSVSDVSHLLVCVCRCFCVTFMSLCVCSATVRFHKIHAKNVSRKRILPTTRREAASLLQPKIREKNTWWISVLWARARALHLWSSLSTWPWKQEDVVVVVVTTNKMPVYPGDGNRRKILTRTDDCVDEGKYRWEGMI